MAKSKDTDQPWTSDAEGLAQDITTAIELAVRTCGEHQLSDQDLDQVCDLILSEHSTAPAISMRQRRMQ